MEPFAGVDFMDLDSLLEEDEILVRNTVREWTEKRVIPGIEDYYERHEFPAELIGEMAELGLLGPNLPETYGCAGTNNVVYGLICQELERGDSGLRSFVSVQGSLVMWPIHEYGSEEQKNHYLPRLARGELVGCYGLTEPDFGSNPGGMVTRAVREGDEWILNGAKMWITNGGIADVAVVWAKAEDEVRGFIVHRDDSGFSTQDQLHKHSLRASVTSELIFTDCRIPGDRILPGARGLRAPLSCLTQARYGIAWGTIGSAMACYDTALQYARERTQFDRPIAGFQLVQERLVRMLSEITKGQLLNLQLGRLKDDGRADFARVSLAKRNGCQVAREAAKLARETLGANGITAEYPIMRHLGNIESVYTYEGTHDMHTLIVGQAITGIAAYT